MSALLVLVAIPLLGVAFAAGHSLGWFGRALTAVKELEDAKREYYNELEDAKREYYNLGKDAGCHDGYRKGWNAGEQYGLKVGRAMLHNEIDLVLNPERYTKTDHDTTDPQHSE